MADDSAYGSCTGVSHDHLMSSFNHYLSPFYDMIGGFV